jgi:capsular exopolysaccharide synthesis family protein
MKVLLVGSDLRKPAIDKVFGVEMTPGLTDILMGNYPWRDTVKTVTDIIMGQMSTDEVMMTPGLDNLHLITSGPIPPNPAELIESARLTAFIEEAKKEYDIILFDSTPILSTADAAILGTKVDGVLLVYRVGTVSRGLLRRSTAQLQQVKCNIMGVVLNGMRPDVSPDFQDYKYYSTYYAYGEEERHKKRAGRRNVFSFIGKKWERKAKGEQKIPPGEKAEGLREKGARKLSKRKVALMLVAMALLTGGLLWKSGVIDPFKPSATGSSIRKDRVISADKRKGPQKRAIPGKPKTVSRQPKRMVSKAKAESQVKKPIPQTPPATKRVADSRKALVKESSSKRVLLKKPERISPRPKTLVSKKKPEAETGTPANAGISKTPAEKKAEIISVKSKGLAIEKKPQPQPVTSSPKRVPTSNRVAVAKTPSAPPKETLSHPYSLYLGSFRTLERAKKAISLYSEKGLSPYCSRVDFHEKGTWFRVFTGHFQDREKAEKFKARHRLKEATVKRTAYANLIGTYEQSTELENRILSLKRMGYFPYVMQGEDGKSRLYVGAFITKEGAEQQGHDLKSRGIESQIVKR